MKRTLTFIETPIFTKRWKDLGLTEEALRLLQNELIENPQKGDMIQGTGGVRKVRIPVERNKGKSGGGRVIYLDLLIYEEIYLIYIFTKKEEANLTQEEKKAIRSAVKRIKEEKANEHVRRNHARP